MQKLTTEGPVKAGFKVQTKELRRVLRLLSKSYGINRKDQYPYCEITIKTDLVEFVVAGIKESISCEARGPARVTIAFEYFIHLVTDRPLLKTKVEVGNEFMNVNDVSVVVDTWFFENDRILRSIDLPVNYEISDILRLVNRYTDEEIEFNKLKDDLSEAQGKLHNDIKKINRILKPYKISPEKVEEFIYQLIMQKKPVDMNV